MENTAIQTLQQQTLSLAEQMPGIYNQLSTLYEQAKAKAQASIKVQEDADGNLTMTGPSAEVEQNISRLRRLIQSLQMSEYLIKELMA